MGPAPMIATSVASDSMPAFYAPRRHCDTSQVITSAGLLLAASRELNCTNELLDEGFLIAKLTILCPAAFWAFTYAVTSNWYTFAVVPATVVLVCALPSTGALLKVMPVSVQLVFATAKMLVTMLAFCVSLTLPKRSSFTELIVLTLDRSN